MASVNVGQWVDMFKEIGLDEAARDKWPTLFEQRHPEAHQSFLEWLGFSEADVKRIRAEHT